MFFDAHVHNKDSIILKYIEKKTPKIQLIGFQRYIRDTKDTV